MLNGFLGARVIVYYNTMKSTIQLHRMEDWKKKSDLLSKGSNFNGDEVNTLIIFSIALPSSPRPCLVLADVYFDPSESLAN
jgi:hypothetical protein